jgi:hypothetical protein
MILIIGFILKHVRFDVFDVFEGFSEPHIDVLEGYMHVHGSNFSVLKNCVGGKK